MEWLSTALGLIMVNLVLSGDNAVVIGMAASRLEGKQKMFAIVFGGIAAIVLRIVFTFLAFYLMKIPALQFVGGLLLFWIALKLLNDSGGHGDHKQAASMWGAIWIITVADVVMSLDNVLAVAAVSAGNETALFIGLAMSMPLVLFAGGLIANLIHKFPWINVVGAVAIAYVAAEMVLADKMVHDVLGANIMHMLESKMELALIPVLAAVAVVVVNMVMVSRRPAAAEEHAAPALETAGH